MVLAFTRIWLPAIVTLAGVVVMVAGGGDDISLEGGAGIIGAGLAIWLMNVLFRVGLHNDTDRDDEDAARDYFDVHGRWPDDAPPPQEPVVPPAAPRTGGDHRAPARVADRRTGIDRTGMRPHRPR